MRQHRRVIGVLLEHYEDVHSPLLKKILLCLPCYLDDPCSARVSSLANITVVICSNPDDGSNVPCTTGAYRLRSHRSFHTRRLMHFAMLEKQSACPPRV